MVEKTTAVVLSVLPYRESSCILHLFSHTHGRIHGIAKGIKSEGPRGIHPERGYLLELNVYSKHNRDLHTLSGLGIVDYYPSIRGDLLRTSFRDTAFELILKSITVTDSHPELFELITAYLTVLENTASTNALFAVLWNFYERFCALLGFGFDLSRCHECGVLFDNNDGYFVIELGGMVCSRCVKTRSESTRVPGYVKSTLEMTHPDNELLETLVPRELVRITRLFTAYCRYHFDIRSEFATLNFLEELLRPTSSGHR